MPLKGCQAVVAQTGLKCIRSNILRAERAKYCTLCEKQILRENSIKM